MPAIQNQNPAISISQNFAREILDNNFFGPTEWLNIYGICLPEKQLWSALDFPWGEDVLNSPCPFHKGKKVKETHFAFLGCNKANGEKLTIMKLQELHSLSRQPRFLRENPWYGKEYFATEIACSQKWYLMPLEVVPDSENKSYAEQKTMLPSEYESPLAIEEVLKNILYYNKNGIYVNHGKCGRCRSVALDGRRVDVGYTMSSDILIGRFEDNERKSYLYIAASRQI